MERKRLRNLGITVGQGSPGPHNAVTDVPGVRVGYSTLIADSPAVVRTGITAIWPAAGCWTSGVFAGHSSFNGNGEMTGMAWIAEQGLLTTPIVITNTHQVGLARDAMCAYAIREGVDRPWMLPVAAETYDGWLSTSEGFPLTRGMVFDALDSAGDGAIAEGNVGGGTGMICHGFKGGTGTSSRRMTTAGGTWTVGALVQANYGRREHLTVSGVSVGTAPLLADVPVAGVHSDAGSIIVVLATDAPLLPIQCQRLARRATVGLARVGGIGANGSGDLFLAFSTANRVQSDRDVHDVRMIRPEAMTALFEAAAEATEEAIINALTTAETMVGRQGRVAYAIPLDRLVDVMTSARPARDHPAARGGLS